MTRRASFTQADLERAIRAAKAEGAQRVVVERGTERLAIDLTPAPPPVPAPRPKPRIVL
jgi:hypothetical protein